MVYIFFVESVSEANSPAGLAAVLLGEIVSEFTEFFAFAVEPVVVAVDEQADLALSHLLLRISIPCRQIPLKLRPLRLMKLKLLQRSLLLPQFLIE